MESISVISLSNKIDITVCLYIVSFSFDADDAGAGAGAGADADVARANRLTAAQKCAHLELMLGQTANYASVIAQNSIVKSSTPSTTYGTSYDNTMDFCRPRPISLTCHLSD